MIIENKIKYAMNRLNDLAKYELHGLNQINRFGNSISLEFNNGMQFELSDKEINHQSILFLESEIEGILND